MAHIEEILSYSFKKWDCDLKKSPTVNYVLSQKASSFEDYAVRSVALSVSDPINEGFLSQLSRQKRLVQTLVAKRPITRNLMESSMTFRCAFTT
ncbi:hypothetical protein KIN20_009873 [Parelaphostrongylus tenuis]|uniref:Uncharacterized protein n=1 Tax=Parelaphostrongylus tenuis TaxID=148309 RepID=A0AAD5QKY3_PARTN|nr:hypothetical protein KIN20_009873 [Parelaphostrongylus tenuis]